MVAVPVLPALYQRASGGVDAWHFHCGHSNGALENRVTIRYKKSRDAA